MALSESMASSCVGRTVSANAAERSRLSWTDPLEAAGLVLLNAGVALPGRVVPDQPDGGRRERLLAPLAVGVLSVVVAVAAPFGRLAIVALGSLPSFGLLARLFPLVVLLLLVGLSLGLACLGCELEVLPAERLAEVLLHELLFGLLADRVLHLALFAVLLVLPYGEAILHAGDVARAAARVQDARGAQTGGGEHAATARGSAPRRGPRGGQVRRDDVRLGAFLHRDGGVARQEPDLLLGVARRRFGRLGRRLERGVELFLVERGAGEQARVAVGVGLVKWGKREKGGAHAEKVSARRDDVRLSWRFVWYSQMLDTRLVVHALVSNRQRGGRKGDARVAPVATCLAGVATQGFAAAQVARLTDDHHRVGRLGGDREDVRSARLL